MGMRPVHFFGGGGAHIFLPVLPESRIQYFDKQTKKGSWPNLCPNSTLILPEYRPNLPELDFISNFCEGGGHNAPPPLSPVPYACDYNDRFCL